LIIIKQTRRPQYRSAPGDTREPHEKSPSQLHFPRHFVPSYRIFDREINVLGD